MEFLLAQLHFTMSQLNKRLLKNEFKEIFDPLEEWGNGNSLYLLKELQKVGIKKAWLGFPDWRGAFINPDFVKQANDWGYLIAPYDSYHSIHENGDNNWLTAKFKDKSLYEKATITNQRGKKLTGFLGRGRKLNPVLSLPSVKERVEYILGTGVRFNSWFIDCDATGEIFDDYSPKHPTTQQQDVQARLDRMKYIRDEKNLVVGSEQGNDFASQTISFAHGLETPVIWGDTDMKNKESKYFVGEYWSKQGGIPDRYAKQVPLKELCKHIYIDPAYSLPLFKLVYNDSVITTHHWEWGSFKISDEVKSTMLKEILYNIPPLYHLDKNSWQADKALIIPHVKLWSLFHQKAVLTAMTSFRVLSEDRLVQLTEFGASLKVVANFSDKDFKYEKSVVKAKSLVIYDTDREIVYKP